ncbi:hypothetical protein [Solidesulfovibrio sp.]|uniref:hypothetical protein n=1 Tax=Solidesulfovibrio sp. TaxID=2910990 RepID=UPI0026135439|nr:hypothetical protein [Solidesulfovibrio sp.]
MRGMLLAVLATALALSGCFAPKAEVAARNWRPMGGSSLPLGRLIALSPGIRTATWESFAGVDGRTVVRLAAEYDPARASAGCPPLAAGLARAARSFLIVDLAVTPDGKVDFIASKAQAYNADGYFEEYDLDIGVVADLVARASPIPCADFGLPAYLR